MFKKGFSTAEILIVLVIVGVIAVAMFTMVRPNDKMYGKLSYKAYDVLNTALYNINADVVEYNEKLYNDAISIGDSVKEEDIKKFPQNVTDLCNKLASRAEGYINTSYTNCGNILSGASGFVDGDGKVIADPTFVATNGMRFYLFNKDWALGAYYIYVDINGTKKPNNVSVSQTKKTDLVPFFISMTDGTLVPDGIALYDGNYLMARVLYSTPDLANGQSEPMNLKSATSAAFGNKEWTKDAMSFSNLGDASGKNANLTSLRDLQISSAASLFPVSSALDGNCLYTNYNLEDDYPPCTIKVVEDN